MLKAEIPDSPPVIIDNGSGMCKAGIAGDDAPRSVVVSVVGRSKDPRLAMGANKKDFYIGEEAQSRRGILTLKHPVEHGIVKSWPDMEKIWKHIYQCELQLRSNEHPLLITEAPLNPVRNRETMAEVLFESFNVPAMYIASEPKLLIYAYGRTTGVLVDSGDGTTYTFPIFDGFQMPHAGKRLDIGGRDITNYLMSLLRESGASFSSSSEKEITKDIKEKLGYVALDLKEEEAKFGNEILHDYTLPDGSTISIGDQCFRAPEALFSPDFIGLEGPGVHKMIYRTILKCDIDVRRNLYNNILLSGGSTLFPGFVDRLYKEMTDLAPSGIPINIVANNERQFSVWLGASVFSSMGFLKNMWISSSEYKEFGPVIVHQKHV